MSEIIVPGDREECDQPCDLTGKPAVAKLVMTFG